MPANTYRKKETLVWIFSLFIFVAVYHVSGFACLNAVIYRWHVWQFFSPSHHFFLRLSPFTPLSHPRSGIIPAHESTIRFPLFKGGIAPAGWRLCLFYSVPSWKHDLSLPALNLRQKWANLNDKKREPHGTRQTIWPVNEIRTCFSWSVGSLSYTIPATVWKQAPYKGTDKWNCSAFSGQIYSDKEKQSNKLQVNWNGNLLHKEAQPSEVQRCKMTSSSVTTRIWEKFGLMQIPYNVCEQHLR